jgi:hypothetical protein
VVGVKGGAAAWHDVECGSYAADLPLWRDLADAAGGPVLAGRGHRVTGLDVDAELVDELARRAREAGWRVDTVTADARSFDLGRSFSLAIAPMQVAQLLGGRSGRVAMMERVREHLSPGSVLAVALADPFEAVPPEDALPPLPDVREEDGWLLSSRPLVVREQPDGGVAVDRLRQIVSPAGELIEEMVTIVLDGVTPDELEDEARVAGLSPAGRRAVPETPDHVGSTVVLAERAR